MAKVKQPLEENGIHRAKMWEIMMYALNNTSTNTYMLVVGYISYFLIGIVGLASVLAGSIVTIMRVWDGVTDPFVGMMVDKTNGKFGKNRPFIVIGQIIMFVTTFVMFNFIPKMGTGVRFVAFIIIYMVYILGYTCQCVVTKSAQTCLTNDPKQRPIFAMCDTVYNIILMNILFPVVVTDSLVPKFTLTAENNAAEIASLVAQNPSLAGIVEKSGGSLSAFYNPGLFTTMQLMFGGLSAVFAVCAIIALWRKDNSKYFGLGTAQKVGVKDYVDTLAHNRAIQMLVVSASTDKLFMSTMSNSTVMICLFGIIFGNYAAFSSYSQITSIPIALISILLMNKIARQMGQKASMMTGTYGGIIGSIIITLFLVFVNPKGDASKFALPEFRIIRPDTWGTLFTGWSAVGLIFILLSIVLWFFGYNAVTSKYSVYASNILHKDYNLTLIIAQAAAIVAYLPVGFIASKVGRKKTILAGVVMLTGAFTVAAFLNADSPTMLMNAMFALAGIGWATINVNSFPMVVELASGGDVGKYTGFYYTASMAAQVATPMVSGLLMDKFGMHVLFPYAAVFTALAFVTMLFVKHGDSREMPKQTAAAGTEDAGAIDNTVEELTND